MESHVLEKIHLQGTILFYNRRVAIRFKYSAVKVTLAVFVLAVLYLLFVFGNRWIDDRYAAEQARAELERKKRLPPELATEEMKVLQFYASPPVVTAGQQALLCYGVLNAKKARIEPEPGEITPALSRCLAVTPRRTVTYTLTIEDGKGRNVTSVVELKVK